jgi:hypothetical protein
MESNNKYSRWVFTLSQGGESNSLPSAFNLKEALESISKKFVFQLERGEKEGVLHFQGCFETRIRKRQSTILTDLQVILQIEVCTLQVDRMCGTWEQAVEYCTKDETSVSKPVLSDDLKVSELTKYQGNDLKVFEKEGFFRWQKAVNLIIFEDDLFTIKPSSGRQVIWIEDTQGNTGKSLFTKMLCYRNPSITKLAFGSGSQMRASVVEEGPMQCYIIDIPRKLCNDDFQNNIYSVIEDLKNGFIKSSMYGKPKTLFMEPPLVIIFSNNECPTTQLSVDRWKIFGIMDNELVHFS